MHSGWPRRRRDDADGVGLYAGDNDGALRELQITLRPMPFEPLRHLLCIGIGCVHFDEGRYARNLLRKNKNLTVAVAREAWPFTPSFMEPLGDGLARAGVPA